MAQEYTQLQGHLDRVRWAWKRAAALQGLSAVIMEGLGMFLLFLLLDYVYTFPQTGRVAMLALMGAIIAYLFVRSVVRPLMRVIPDEQVALYIEERQNDTEGALLSATTFGKAGARGEDGGSPIYGFIVGRIVQSAVDKAGAIQLSRVLNLSKLRKYAIAALIVLLFFGASALRFSNFFGSRAKRLLMPWNMTDEDLKASGALVDAEPKTTFEITTNAAGNRILRGGSIKVKAKLSRTADSDVQLKFRTVGAVDFQKLKMDEIDELNTFALRLPDVNDDIEIMAETGKNEGGKSVSDVVRVSVYDLLAIKGYEVTLVPPPYTKQPPTTDFGPAGDITALEGTVVKFRALANTPLAKGELVFDDGTKVALAGEKSKDNAAAGEFIVSKNGTYMVHIVAADDQKGDPSSSFSVKMLKDEPPSVAVVEPQADMSAHSSAEVLFKAKVSDDVGIGSVELVYSTSQQDNKFERVKIKLDAEGPGDHDAEAVLALQDFQPRLQPGDNLFYHFEVRDLKGQPAISDIFLLSIRPYEIAGAFPELTPAHHHPHAPALDLMLFIAAAWNIQGQKELIQKSDYDERCNALAGRMLNPDGTVIKLKKPKPSQVAPDKVPLIAKGDEIVKTGIAKLKEHDAGEAVVRFREALTVWKSLGVSMDMQDEAEIQEMGEAAGPTKDPMQDALGFMKMAPKMEQESPHYDVNLPDYRRSIKPEDAKKLKEDAQDLQHKQDELNKEAKKLAAVEENNKKEDKNDPNEKKENKDKEVADAEKKDGENNDQNKPNDPKNGAPQQAHAGNPKDGEAKPNPDNKMAGAEGRHDEKPNDPNAKPGDTPPEAHGDQTADNDERKANLQRQQENLAAQARNLAKRMAEAAPKADKNEKEVIEHFRNSSKQMDAAAAEIKDGNLQRAAARGEEARKELHAAADKLQLSQFDNLDKAVEAADERAALVAETQKQIKDGMNKVLDDAHARNKTEPANKNAADPKLNNQDVQKLQGLARMQVDNQKNAEDLEKYVGDLQKWADDMHKKDAADELKKASRLMKQDNIASTMVTAAVNLGQQEIADAKDAQEKLDKSLEKLTGALHAANSALAGTKEQKLKRALGDVKELVAKAEKLAGVPHEDKDANAAGAQKPDNKGDDKENGKQADANDPKKNAGKDGEKKPGDQQPADGQKHPGADGQDEHKNGEKTADAKNNPDGAKNGEKDGEKNGDKNEKTADNNKNANEKGGKKDKELTPEERRDLQAEIGRATVRLAKRIEEDKLADGPIQAQLTTLKSEKSFEEMFKDAQKTKLGDYLGAMHAVSSHLENKLESVLKAKRLSASQREQTPTQYRDMVNKYYEQLAKE